MTLTRRLAGAAMATLLVACTPAPSASSPPGTGPLPSSSPVAVASPSAPVATSTPSSAATDPPSAPPATPDPRYVGSFEILPGSPRTDFHADIACTGSIGAADPVALVELAKGGGSGGGTVLRDYADLKNPRTVCTFGDTYIRQLIDATHVVIQDQDESALYAVVDLPAVRYRWFQLPETGSEWGADLITVGPALDRIVWNDVHAGDSDTDVIKLTTANSTRDLATLPDTNSGRCGEAADSMRGSYAANNAYLYVLNQPILANHSLLVVKGRQTLLSVVPPHVEWGAGENAPVMALWSPVSPTLYWSQGGDAWTWTPDGGRQKLLAGVAWLDATISADGRYLAYSVARPDGRSIVYLVDLAGDGVPRKIGDGPRGQPRFLNATQLFWRVQGAGAGCAGPLPDERIYDVTSGAEDGSIILRVNGTWPATSAKQWS